MKGESSAGQNVLQYGRTDRGHSPGEIAASDALQRGPAVHRSFDLQPISDCEPRLMDDVMDCIWQNGEGYDQC